MAIVECHETSDKGLSQGYYGGGGGSFGQKMSDMAGWAFEETTKRENKYQGGHNGYAMGYSQSQGHGQIRCPPKYGMSESYGKTEFRHEYGRHSNEMSKPQIQGHGYGHGHGFGGQHSSNGMILSVHGSPKRHQNLGYNGYSHSPNHGGHGFSSYERTEAHAYDEFETTNGYGGHAGGFMKTQLGHPGRNMAYESKTESSLYKKSEARYSNGRGGYGYYAGNYDMGCNGNMGLMGKMKMKSRSLSGNSSCSDDSESDDEECGRKEVWASKAL